MRSSSLMLHWMCGRDAAKGRFWSLPKVPCTPVVGLLESTLGTWLVAAVLAETGVDMQLVLVEGGCQATLGCHSPALS